AQTGKHLRDFPPGWAALSPDGKHVAVCTRGGEQCLLRLYESRTGKELASWPSPMATLVFSPDGKALAALALSGPVTVRDVATGQQLWKSAERFGSPYRGRYAFVRRLAYSSDGKCLYGLDPP